MQTRIPASLLDKEEGREADRILRACVHCGFCNATCPTYQLLGDELDGPRGRIYLIKRVMEGGKATRKTRLHLDRCLTCLACETTCPSGVQYARLLETGRALVEARVKRRLRQRLLRRALLTVFPHAGRTAALVNAARLLRPLLPAALRDTIPPRHGNTPAWPKARHTRTMLVFDGCVQPALAPGINAAAARLLDGMGITPVRAREAGCCGALSHHLSATGEALRFARRNIDAWWPHVMQGAEALVFTASGCGAFIREYGRLLCHDPRYADKARRLAEMAKDIGGVLARENPAILAPAPDVPRTIAFHAPCTLQHGLRLGGVVEGLLEDLGFRLTRVPDAHLCCGAAGTYSILQGGIADRLRRDKVRALASGGPALIATANIGCLLHLRKAAGVPVRHWVELVTTTDEAVAR